MERIRHSEIAPLEVWDLCVDGGTLGELRSSSNFPDALRGAIETLRSGLGATRSDGPLPPIVSGFEAVILTGGRAREDELLERLSSLPCAILFGGEGVHAGARGGFELLRVRGFSGWVLDLGQSHLKLATPERRWTFPRDSSLLRAAHKVSPTEIPAQRRRLREFIALKLQIAMAETGHHPQALVFALPTRVSDEGTPQGGDYAGMAGDQALLPDALALAGLPGLPLLVLNDAELAALSALADPRLAAFKKVLVLTLGFGIGAALIHRES